MKGVLHLFDMSSYVYTGMNIPTYASYNLYGYPMGGIKYFIKYFTPHLVSMNDFACFFDSSSFRKKLLPSYKSGRIGSNHAVYSQLDLLYDLLMKANIPCYKSNGFEADDLIFTAVESSKDYSSIIINSSDYDLAHNVDERVSFESVNSNANNVNLNNFQFSIEKGKKILPNTLSAYKVFTGCKSDKIPSFVSEKGVSGEVFYQRFCDFLISNLNPYSIKVSKDRRSLQIFLNTIKDELTPKDLEFLDRNIELVYPRLDSSMNFSAANRTNVDLESFAKILSLCGEQQGLRLINKHRIDITSEEISVFKKKAHELRTGEFAADRSIDFTTVDVSSEVINMRSF